MPPEYVRKMYVRYKGGGEYVCNHLRSNEGLPTCQHVRAASIDIAVADAFLTGLAPAEFDALSKARPAQGAVTGRILCGQSGHQIATMVNVSRYTVAEYLRCAAVVGITSPVPVGARRRGAGAQAVHPALHAAEALRLQPDWPRIPAELRKLGVTLLLLWEEYRAGEPNGTVNYRG